MDNGIISTYTGRSINAKPERWIPIAITGDDGKVIWQCEIVDGQLTFENDDRVIESAAKRLFEGVLKQVVDAYIESRLADDKV